MKVVKIFKFGLKRLPLTLHNFVLPSRYLYLYCLDWRWPFLGTHAELCLTLPLYLYLYCLDWRRPFLGTHAELCLTLPLYLYLYCLDWRWPSPVLHAELCVETWWWLFLYSTWCFQVYNIYFRLRFDLMNSIITYLRLKIRGADFFASDFSIDWIIFLKSLKLVLKSDFWLQNNLFNLCFFGCVFTKVICNPKLVLNTNFKALLYQSSLFVFN